MRMNDTTRITLYAIVLFSLFALVAKAAINALGV